MAELTIEKIAAWLSDFAEVVAENADYLTDLDRQIGDADHGSNLARGMKAVTALISATDFASPSELLKKAGMTLVSTVGGASGPLYGTFFLRMAGAITGAQSAVTEFEAGLKAGLEGIQARGKSTAGEKTMIDALSPAYAAFTEAADSGLAEALTAAAKAAVLGRDSTIPMLATKGRASYLGERSIGHLDPGAASITMLLEAAARTWTK